MGVVIQEAGGELIGVRIQGARELRRNLTTAGDDLTGLKDTHKRAAEIAAASIRDLAPVRSGALKASIRAAGTKTAALVRIGKKSVPYANAIQWGRRVWPSKTASPPPPPRHKYMSFIKPRLFATDGAKLSEPQWVAVYEKGLAEALDKITGETP